MKNQSKKTAKQKTKRDNSHSEIVREFNDFLEEINELLEA